MKTIILSLTLVISLTLFSKDPVQSGPMVGYSTMKEVLLWVQTKEPAQVYFEYFDQQKPEERYKTATCTTAENTGFVASLIANKVQPSTKYTYELFINGKRVLREYPMEFQSQTLWQWRTDPPEVNFAIGSCNYVNEPEVDRPGKGYGSEYEIFTSIYEKKPDFMLWLGDNTYLREADWNSRTGFLHRYTHTRSLPEMQPLLASTHNYAIWDDHDFGPNDADGSYWMKEIAAEMFQLFWANPNYNVVGNGGITGTFHWADLQFFLLDNRYHRTSNKNFTEKRQMLGKEQIDWLINALASSKANFKFIVIGGQVLSTEAWFENHATFAEERQYLLQKIRAAKIEGVVFLDGDRHHTILSMQQENNAVYPFYDLTCSSLTAGANKRAEPLNTSGIKETIVNQHNFGLLNVSGPKNDRVLKINICDKNGNIIWTRAISANKLKY